MKIEKNRLKKTSNIDMPHYTEKQLRASIFSLILPLRNKKKM